MHKILPIFILIVLTFGNAKMFAQDAQNVETPNPKASGKQPSAAAAKRFIGYWMGVDPLDGGDSRRGITRNSDGTFSVVGRDTVFTLCDNTDRAILLVSDAVIVNSELSSDDLEIKCFNTGLTVHLKVHYEVVDTNIVVETTTQQNGIPVDQIIFHRVSQR
jgi:hypothetical protein